jgi:hypothetical protein
MNRPPRGPPVSAKHRALNSSLCKARSTDEIWRILDAAWGEGTEPNSVNLATSIHRLGKFTKNARAGIDPRLERYPPPPPTPTPIPLLPILAISTTRYACA